MAATAAAAANTALRPSMSTWQRVATAAVAATVVTSPRRPAAASASPAGADALSSPSASAVVMATVVASSASTAAEEPLFARAAAAARSTADPRSGWSSRNTPSVTPFRPPPVARRRPLRGPSAGRRHAGH